jgi:hypothetical protein
MRKNTAKNTSIKPAIAKEKAATASVKIMPPKKTIFVKKSCVFSAVDLGVMSMIVFLVSFLSIKVLWFFGCLTVDQEYYAPHLNQLKQLNRLANYE